MEAFDVATEALDRAMGIARHLTGVAATDALQAALEAVEPVVAAFESGIYLDTGLWNAVKAFAETAEARGLTGERLRFLEKTLDAFRRQGAELDEAGKTRLKEIGVELSTVTTRFRENVRQATNAFELVITEEAGLAGLPGSAVAMARASAQSKNRAGWRFTLQQPSYLAVMTYLDDAAVRERMWRAFNTRAHGGEFDNAKLISRILELRAEKARLLGYGDFADLILEERMAGSGARAAAFLDDLRGRTTARFGEENRSLEAFAGRPLQPWDIGYWSEKERATRYGFDEEALKPYFPLERVVDGMYQLMGGLFGFRVTEVPGVPGWDDAVRFYDIHDTGSGAHLGSFYADWFPRENKRPGAWMDAFVTAKPGKPHLGLICGNLTPPVDGKPALLTHRDVETIFHEFGHLLHHCLSEVGVRHLCGTNVPWDFVELPSQIMENWCWERAALDRFASHYETSEPLPEDLFQKMRAARQYRAANAQMRQLSFGITDLNLHRVYAPSRDGSVVEYALRCLREFAAAPLTDDYAMITSFLHLFSDPVGYGAGYYSYKWAEVLDADAFTRFRAEGVFNTDTGRAYRAGILARGNSDDPAALYRGFMGRDPDANALLVRSGLAA